MLGIVTWFNDVSLSVSGLLGHLKVSKVSLIVPTDKVYPRVNPYDFT